MHTRTFLSILAVGAVLALVLRPTSVSDARDADKEAGRPAPIEAHAPEHRGMERPAEAASVRSEVAGLEPADTSTGPRVPAGLGSVTVQLVTGTAKQPVGCGVVEVRSGTNIAGTARVDGNGTATLHLVLGTYAVRVDPDSLPAGLVPAARQDDPWTGRPWPRVHAPRFELSASAPTATVDVPVFRSSRIHGRVTHGGDLAADRAVVQCASIAKGRPAYTYTTTTSGSGHYDLSVVPGPYRVQVVLAAGDAPSGRLAAPLPEDVLVEAGDDVLADFDLSPGTGVLAGRVVDLPLLPDEQELRWSDLSVAVKPHGDFSSWPVPVHGYRADNVVASVRTDAEGHFRVTGLHAGDYAVTFGYDEFRSTGEVPRIGAYVEPVIVRVPPAGTRDLGTVLVPRARPCRVAGQLRSDVLDPTQAEIEVEFPSNSLSVVEPYTLDVTPDAWGQFEFWAHTSPDATPATVRVRRRGAVAWEREQQLTLHPNGIQAVALTYP